MRANERLRKLELRRLGVNDNPTDGYACVEEVPGFQHKRRELARIKLELKTKAVHEVRRRNPVTHGDYVRVRVDVLFDFWWPDSHLLASSSSDIFGFCTSW